MPEPRNNEVDVVVVPDFTGPQSDRFEILTLFVLGSWLDAGGTQSTWSLHVASVGDPPLSVQRLASTSGALLSVHSPVCALPEVRTQNKMRGFEVTPTTSRLLLIDADILFASFPTGPELRCRQFNMSKKKSHPYGRLVLRLLLFVTHGTGPCSVGNM